MESTRLFGHPGADPEVPQPQPQPQPQLQEAAMTVQDNPMSDELSHVAAAGSSSSQATGSRGSTYHVVDQLARPPTPPRPGTVEPCQAEDTFSFRLTIEHFMVLNADYYRPISTALKHKIWPPLNMINDRTITFTTSTASRPIHVHLAALEPLSALYYLSSEISPCMSTHALSPAICPMALLALLQTLYHTQPDDPYPNTLTTHPFQPINFLEAIPLAVQFSASPEIYPRLRMHMAYAFHIMLTPAIRRRELFGLPPSFPSSEDNDADSGQNKRARFYPTQDPYSLSADNAVLERMARYSDETAKGGEQENDGGMRQLRREEFLAVQMCLRRSRSIFPLDLRPFTVGAYAHLVRVMGMRVLGEVGREEIDSELLFESAMLMEGVKSTSHCSKELEETADGGKGEGQVSLELDLWQYPVDDLVLAYPRVWARLQDCIMRLEEGDEKVEDTTRERKRVEKDKGKQKATVPDLEGEEEDKAVVEEAILDVMMEEVNCEKDKDNADSASSKCPMQ